MFSGGACKDKSFGEDLLAEVNARMSHAVRMCLAEVFSRISHEGKTCLAEVLARMSLAVEDLFSRGLQG